VKNKSAILNIVLALIIIILIVQLVGKKGVQKRKDIRQGNVEEKSDNKESNPIIAANATLTTIFNRKSVRHYTGRRVSQEQLTLLVNAGMAAPTAADKRPWAFIVVQDRNMLNQLADVLPYAKMLKTASAAIVVCGDLSKALKKDAQPYWIQDCSAASENILLAAESIGLGAVWTGVTPILEREKAVGKLLKTPTNIIPFNVIAVGYPEGIEKPKNKWDKSILHWEKWSGK